MKKIFLGLLVLTTVTSCVKDEEVIIEKENLHEEKTKTIRKVSAKNQEAFNKELDSIGHVGSAEYDLGQSDESGEVGPVTTTPPK